MINRVLLLARFARFARFFQRKGVERSPKIFFFPRQKKKGEKNLPDRPGVLDRKWCANLATPANHLRLCGGAPPLHAHARLRARRARRTGTGHRRDPWQSPLHPGSPREARSALAFEMRWLISLPSPETCGISARRGGARGAAGPPRAARRLGGRLRRLPRPARGRLGARRRAFDHVRASPHHVAHPAPLSLDHQQELLDASV